MKYAYFPGCSLCSTSIEYDMSTRAAAEVLGLELWEIPEWNCCGASSGHVTDHLLALALPARNMAIAEEAGLDVAIPCAACYARCKASEVAVGACADTRKAVEDVIERPYEGRAKAKSMLDVLANTVPLATVEQNVKIPLTEIKAACYYGCLLVRPRQIGFDDAEDPQSMDRLLHGLGAASVAWSHKTECCGASHPTTNSEVGLNMLDRILAAASEAGANCIVTACPMCLNNLDMRQGQVQKTFGRTYDLPVYYFTELMGLAFGLEPQHLGLDKHFTDAMPLVNKVLKAAGRRETA